MKTPCIASIQVGLPKTLGENQGKWRSAIMKEPVEGRIWLGKTNLEGDRQADLRVHGGPDKAVCVYPARHYPIWSRELGRDLKHGAFGENFTVDGLAEGEVCIGDTFAAGEAAVQVTQPRQPCQKLARRFGIDEIILRVHTTGRTGWYFRVLREGFVERGDALTLTERPHPHWTIARVYELRFDPKAARESAIALADCPLLSERWRQEFRRKTV